MAEDETSAAPDAGESTAAAAEAPTDAATDAATGTGAAPRTPPADAAGPASTGERAGRKVREGLVVSDKMQATVVVAVVERVRHARYGKTVQRTQKLYAHDGGLDAHTGDRVRVMETRPLSKLKRWRVTEVLERAR